MTEQELQQERQEELAEKYRVLIEKPKRYHTEIDMGGYQSAMTGTFDSEHDALKAHIQSILKGVGVKPPAVIGMVMEMVENSTVEVIE